MCIMQCVMKTGINKYTVDRRKLWWHYMLMAEESIKAQIKKFLLCGNTIFLREALNTASSQEIFIRLMSEARREIHGKKLSTQ